MDLYEFFNTFLVALGTDTDLDAWAKSNFGQGVQVYADLPADDLPDEETDTPYVLLHSPGRENDRERNTIEYVLGLWLVLNVDTYNTRLEGTVTEPSGVELMCDFITKVQAAITAALPANFSLAFSIDTDTLGQKPEVHGFLAATFTQRLCLGTDPLA